MIYSQKKKVVLGFFICDSWVCCVSYKQTEMFHITFNKDNKLSV